MERAQVITRLVSISPKITKRLLSIVSGPIWNLFINDLQLYDASFQRRAVMTLRNTLTLHSAGSRQLSSMICLEQLRETVKEKCDFSSLGGGGSI
jgi:hypothetical protein